MRADPVEAILKKYGDDPSQLIGALQDIQGTYKYLSYDTLLQMSEKTQIPLSRIYSLATFFKAFSLKPRGEHLVTVCMGTACHVREAPRIVEEISRSLGIPAGGFGAIRDLKPFKPGDLPGDASRRRSSTSPSILMN
jgi:NADH-quinone oxidoreductase subunit E